MFLWKTNTHNSNHNQPSLEQGNLKKREAESFLLVEQLLPRGSDLLSLFITFS